MGSADESPPQRYGSSPFGRSGHRADSALTLAARSQRVQFQKLEEFDERCLRNHSWKGRSELRSTLAANSALFIRHNVEVIVANCGGNPEELEELLEGQEIPGMQHVSTNGI